MEPFAHLHVHTEYSLLDGQCKIGRLFDKAAKDGMPGFAITDYGNMFGIKEFFDIAAKQNKGREQEVILLDKNKHGYQNLIKLVSIGWVDGYYMRPRIDHKVRVTPTLVDFLRSQPGVVCKINGKLVEDEHYDNQETEEVMDDLLPDD